MSELGERWGIIPSYFSWRGDVIQTSAGTEQAILTALGATENSPPPSGGVPAEGREGADRCFDAPDRVWGWAIQLYALRSRESWGIGDFADLRNFGRWSKRAGASVILLNPLGAQNPTLPYQASPYYSSTRRFRNIIYLRLEEIDGWQHVSADAAATRQAALDLNNHRQIEYDQVFRFKSSALERIFRAEPHPRGLDSWVRRQGRALHNFALFNALCERHGPAWRNWPQELRHPGGLQLEAAQQQHAERIAFHEWLQFHLDKQFSRAARAIDIITDVPVGFASDGYDAWRWRDYLAPGVRVGAPPDEFFRDGQDWGSPPFNPWLVGRAKWEPFVDAIRSAARHAAGVRLDHVMSLFRLFWVPDGMTPGQGAYVHYPAPILLWLLARESQRARAFVIGEDLGLVEPSVRKHLREKNSLSYRLLWFESSDPSHWPHDAVAAIGTHDLPTVAGIWTLSEPEHRLHYLREKLIQITQLPDSARPLDVAVAAYRTLARGQTRITLVQIEDALGVHERPNVPGTTTEFPNWRLALPMPLDQIERFEGVNRIVDEMKAAGR